MEQNREYLKSKFNTGDRPSEQDYHDLIDSFFNKKDDEISGGSGSGAEFHEVGTIAERDELSVEPGAIVLVTANEYGNKAIYFKTTSGWFNPFEETSF